MNKQIVELQAEFVSHTDEAAKYKRAIEALQDICKHKWTCTGHSHNDSYYQCDDCGKDKWE